MLGIYITAGYPNTQSTIKALRILDEANVDLIELGVPFSDPLADGPVIQKAAYEALQQGMNLDKVFELLAEARKPGVQATSGKGLNNVILFSYYNPLYAYGWDKLIQQCLKHKVRGALIPDLPVDEAEILSKKFKDAGLDLILLAAITSTEERLRRIYDLSSPFIYLVSRIGITGSDSDNASLRGAERSEAILTSPSGSSGQAMQSPSAVIQKLKSFGNKPIGLGFGIDSRTKVEDAYKAGADMAIVGTKAVRVLENCDESMSCFKEFIKALKAPVEV